MASSPRLNSALLEPFATSLVAHDFPGLPDTRRQLCVDFTLERIAAMPGPMRLGVLVLAVTVRAAMMLLGRGRLVDLLAPTTLPLMGEYVRLHRSLAYAYVWETWPDTRADGSPG